MGYNLIVEIINTILSIASSVLSIGATFLSIKNRRDIEHYMDLSTNSDISQKGNSNTVISGSGNAVGRSG